MPSAAQKLSPEPSHRSRSAATSEVLQRFSGHAIPDHRPASARLAQLAAIANVSAETTSTSTLQRVAEEEEDQPVQGKFAVVQRRAPIPINDDPALEHEADVMGAKALQTKPEGGTVQRLESSGAPNTTGLPDQLKSGAEALSGESLDDVKVHYNSEKPAQLNALAYAQGTDIHIAPGQEKHLPHETWHAVQQKRGEVEPTCQKARSGEDTGERSKDVPCQLTAASDAQTSFDEHQEDLESIKPKFEAEKVAWSPDGLGCQGLKHWASETQKAALRHYNELNFVQSNLAKGKNMRLGTDNKKEPDVRGTDFAEDRRYHTEIKTTHQKNNGDVNPLIIKALKQLEARCPEKGTKWKAEVVVYLANPECKWPFTSDTDSIRGATNDVFMRELKKQSSIKKSIAEYSNVTNVTITVFYSHGKIGYKSFVDINLNEL